MFRCLIIIFFLTTSLLFGENYNYYHRNYNGTFILENINFINKKGITISPVYFLNNSDEKHTITGYYYSTRIIKFIDVIEDNRIVSTVYYDTQGNEILIKKYKYEDKILKQYEISLKTQENFYFCKNIFNYSNHGIDFIAFRVIETNNDLRFKISAFYYFFIW